MLFYVQQYHLDIHIIPVHIMTVIFAKMAFLKFFPSPTLRIGL